LANLRNSALLLFGFTALAQALGLIVHSPVDGEFKAP
jgi:hypothetical protein